MQKFEVKIWLIIESTIHTYCILKEVSGNIYIPWLSVLVLGPLARARARVCVCVRERERERPFKLLPASTRYAALWTARRLVACVISEEGKRLQPRSSGMLAALPTGNHASVKCFISCKPVFVLREQAFWVVALCGWIIAFHRFEGTYCRHLQGNESVSGLITLKIKAVLCFETSGSNHPIAWCNNPENPLPQQSIGENFKSLFSCC